MRLFDTLDFVFRSVVAWLTRARTPETWIFKGAAVVLVAVSGINWAFKYTGRINGADAVIEVGTSGGGLAASILSGLTVFCAFLMALSVVWAIIRYRTEQRRLSRKKVYVVEARGLRDDNGAPLEEAVPKAVEGARTGYVLDVRQRKDGSIVEPEDLLEPVQAMKTWLHQAQRNLDRADLTTVFGGLAAVPVTFLAGLLIDDEGSVWVMDWDRTRNAWRSLDGVDDGLRFVTAGLDQVNGATEAVLAVSASYQIKAQDLATTFSCPVVTMSLPDVNSSHWSHTKQSELADQVFATVKALDAKGVEQIHLVLAAQSSIVFNLGRRYDKRNLPKVAVYQYERAENPRYPWAIQMPVAGVRTASVLRRPRE